MVNNDPEHEPSFLHSSSPSHKEAIKTLVVLHSGRKAARIAVLREITVKSWALRYGWNKLPKPSPHPAHPIRIQSPARIV
jgi:hypothetical protein